ncbi:MAG: hypothetical protein KDJ35_09185 [Alphaproteobacteria bacterium]|nr:hypothetical protein [Alphaproteobacteria bacterium]
MSGLTIVFKASDDVQASAEDLICGDINNGSPVAGGSESTSPVAEEYYSPQAA